MTTTPHFPLPYLFAAQAGKELTHNEALLLIDFLLHRRVLAVGSDPINLSNLQEGQAWIVATGATGDWAAHEGQLALFAAGGWRFVTPPDGMTMWVESAGVWMRRDGQSWQMPPQAPTIATGANQDDGARTALVGLISALSNWGLLAPAPQ